MFYRRLTTDQTEKTGIPKFDRSSTLNDCQCLSLLGICEDLNGRIPDIVIINIVSILEKNG